ncbi:hypothetical protein HK405_004655 [Cladochytrium tenue]|nr:hypothetical protein HK405_004655 [Cladochytrium tenue]
MSSTSSNSQSSSRVRRARPRKPVDGAFGPSDLSLNTKPSGQERFASELNADGMTKIFTVAKAKVPICKFYDPEL